MKNSRRFLFYFSCLLVVILFLLSTTVLIFIIERKIERSGTYNAPEIKGKVIIKRDSHGIPHITALKDDNDLFFALGFVHAQDRFWQMDFQRHLAEGRLSEIFGKDTIDEDKYLRTWGLYRSAATDWSYLDKRTQSIVHSYTQGINFYLATNPLPLQDHLLRYKPPTWTDIDTLVLGKLIAWDMETNWQKQWINAAIAKKYSAMAISILQPSYPSNAPTVIGLSESSPNPTKNNILHYYFKDMSIKSEIYRTSIISMRQRLGIHDLPGKGSNNWVVSGKLTASGKPILACDPHLDLQAPSLWYLAELRGPNLHVIGATIPGSPVVEIGHNDFIAWGETNVNPDTQDLYIEPSNATFKIINERIKVKDGKTINYQIKISTHGPIISDVVIGLSSVGKNVAIKWAALQPGDTTLESLVKINYANNWSEFKNALHYFIAPSQNFIYADTDGNIGYYMPGKIPLRNWKNTMPILPNQHFEWNGYIPFDKLPHLYNPPSGLIATANNKVPTDTYRYLLNFRWETPPYRIERISDMLSKSKNLTVKYMQSIQLDSTTYLWRSLKPNLLATQPLNAESQRGLNLLKGWDGNMSESSISATVFAYWNQQLNLLLPDTVSNLTNWSEPLFISQQLRVDGNFCKNAGYINCSSFLSYSLKNAMDNLIQDHGHNEKNWRWGAIHKAKFNELGLGQVKAVGWLWNRSIATRGDENTIFAAAYDSHFTQVEGASYRQIVDLSHFNNSLYMLDLGEVDDPFSRHQHDLLPLWSKGGYLHMTSVPDKEISQRLTLLPYQ